MPPAMLPCSIAARIAGTVPPAGMIWALSSMSNCLRNRCAAAAVAAPAAALVAIAGAAVVCGATAGVAAGFAAGAAVGAAAVGAGVAGTVGLVAGAGCVACGAAGVGGAELPGPHATAINTMNVE